MKRRLPQSYRALKNCETRSGRINSWRNALNAMDLWTTATHSPGPAEITIARPLAVEFS
jgi:hypothetical protein